MRGYFSRTLVSIIIAAISLTSLVSCGGSSGGDELEVGSESELTRSVTVINNSGRTLTFFIFQTQTGSSVPDGLPVVWQSRSAWSGSSVRFDWSEDYLFYWANVGSIAPGVVVRAEAIVSADLLSRNEITFTNSAGTASFENQTSSGNPRALTIVSDQTIAFERYGVGIGMSGSPTFVSSAQPNFEYKYPTPPTYWIAALENIENGQVLNAAQVPQKAELNFAAGVYSLRATFNPDHSWSVSPSPW